MSKFLFFIPVSIITFLLWLIVPLIISLIIDKVILQNSTSSLALLFMPLIISLIVASIGEYISNLILNSLTSQDRKNSKRKLINVRQVSNLVRILLLLSFVGVWCAPELAVESIVVSLIITFIVYLLLSKKKITSSTANDGTKKSVYNTLLLFYYLIFIIAFAIPFGMGSFLIINGQLTLGQLIGSNVIAVQVTLLCLNSTISFISQNEIESGR